MSTKGILLTILVVTVTKYILRKAKDYFGGLFIVLPIAIYVYGSITFLNCWYDRSSPENYQVAMVDKSISKGKTRTYHLKLAPWGERLEEENVNVSREQFEVVTTGDDIEVNLHQGFF